MIHEKTHFHYESPIEEPDICPGEESRIRIVQCGLYRGGEEHGRFPFDPDAARVHGDADTLEEALSYVRGLMGESEEAAAIHRRLLSCAPKEWSPGIAYELYRFPGERVQRIP